MRNNPPLHVQNFILYYEIGFFLSHLTHLTHRFHMTQVTFQILLTDIIGINMIYFLGYITDKSCSKCKIVYVRMSVCQYVRKRLFSLGIKMKVVKNVRQSLCHYVKTSICQYVRMQLFSLYYPG